MTTKKILLCVFTVLCALGPSEGRAEEKPEARDWKVSVSVNYETGKYGTTSNTDTFYMPVTIKKYFPDMGDISLTIPYISQTGSSDVTNIDGTVFQTKLTPGAPVTNSGVGDLILRGSYYLFSESRNVPFDLNLTAKIKVPTADDSRGLGTGEFDTGFGLEFAKTLPSGFTGYLDIYYTAIGDPPGLDLEDRVSFDAGFSLKIAPQWTMSAFYEESTPLLKSNSHLRDLLLSFEFKANSRSRLFFGTTLGLTDTSPEYGLSLGASFLL
jgi:hypothetical protein